MFYFPLFSQVVLRNPSVPCAADVIESPCSPIGGLVLVACSSRQLRSHTPCFQMLVEQARVAVRSLFVFYY